jgi:hypothetical protein
MTQICDCPFGFEDGHILGYRAHQNRLEVDFEFWNEKCGTFVFEGVVAVHDDGAMGAIVGFASRSVSSDLLVSMIGRNFEVPPEISEYQSFRFVDLDDKTMFEVIAHSCLYSADKHQSAS